MQVEVNGSRLWFDVDGPALVPDGSTMRERPTVVLVHGGPGGFDHSYFKPDFTALAPHAQVVYLDLRDHGRSARHDPTDWTFEVCADDVRALCDAIGIARRDFGGDPVSDEESTRVFTAFGPRIPDEQQLARRVESPELGPPGIELVRRLDVVDQLARIDCPTLVCVGELDPVTPVDASHEIVDGLPDGIGRLEVIAGAGHFPWLDAHEAYWPVIEAFVATATHG